MRSRRALTLIVILIAALLPAVPAQAQTDELEWTFVGSGWGHGVGMSQYGAFGMALEGATAAEILGHYYSGAELVDISTRDLPDWWPDPYEIKVNLIDGADDVVIGAWNGEAELCQGDCAEVDVVPAYDEVTISRSGDGCAVDGGEAGECYFEVGWDNDGGMTRIVVDGDEYAHGRLLVDLDNTGNMNVVLEVELELYLRGIAEIPGSWPEEVQKAQVIAARNYVIRKLIQRGEDGAANCRCHVRDTVADQVYGGWAKEGIQPNRWVDAVEATDGQVAIHPSSGLVFTAYYSSSSGGATENNEDVWGGAPAPYLRSVDDPWVLIPEVGNPNREWARAMDADTLASILGWDELIDAMLVAGPPGATVRFWGMDGGESVEKDYSGESLRTTFDLKSPWVSDVISPLGFQDARLSIHSEDITFIAELGITKGCNPPDNTRFCPDATVTRGQMAAFLVRALGLPEADEDYFTDDDGLVFEDDINRIAQAGITRGCSDDRFCADGVITREQMAAFMARAFDLTETSEVEFSDDGESQFENSINALATAGVTRGCNPPDNTRFCPTEAVTRGQMASFITRALTLGQ